MTIKFSWHFPFETLRHNWLLKTLRGLLCMTPKRTIALEKHSFICLFLWTCSFGATHKLTRCWHTIASEFILNFKHNIALEFMLCFSFTGRLQMLFFCYLIYLFIKNYSSDKASFVHLFSLVGLNFSTVFTHTTKFWSINDSSLIACPCTLCLSSLINFNQTS